MASRDQTYEITHTYDARSLPIISSLSQREQCDDSPPIDVLPTSCGFALQRRLFHH